MLSASQLPEHHREDDHRNSDIQNSLFIILIDLSFPLPMHSSFQIPQDVKKDIEEIFPKY